MKRIFSILAVMLALASCKNKEDIFEVDDTLHRTGKVTLLASIEDFSTKAEMPATGHGAWKRNDMIAVQVSDGSFVEFKLEGTGDTRRAKFTGEVPEGLTLGNYAVFPSDAVKNENGKVIVDLPSERDYEENSFDGLMTAKIQDTWEIEFRQMLSFVNVNFGNFPNGGSRLVLSEPGMSLSGNIEVELDNLIENGIRLQTGEGTLSYNLPSAGSKFSMQILLPVGEYRSLNAEILDKNGEVISSKELFTIPFNAERSAMKSIGCELDTDPEQPASGDVKVGTVSLSETASGSKIYEGTVDVAATSDFTVSIGDTEYGFASYSGAGGLGKITSEMTSLPCYNFASANTAKSQLYYEVSRAIGTMAKISDGGNKFTTSLAAAGKALVRVDLNGATPKYYMELVKNADPSVVFHENFDLCTYGGDYMVAIAGTKDSAMDGVTPGSKGGATANNPSFVFDYPIAGTASGGVASNTYLENRGFQGWVFEYAGERPGCLQLCSGSAPGNITTPKMSKLSAATDVTLRLDIARFSTTSVDPIKVVIVGGGEIVSGHVDIEAYKAAGTAAASKDYTIGAASFDIVDDQYCPHTLANGDADKPHSVFTFQVKGMTPDSKVLIDCPKGAKNAPRCFIFDIKVTK